MTLLPIYEAVLMPRDPKASITRIVVRVDDPVNIYDTDTLLNFLEIQFPTYKTDHIISGYKMDREENLLP